MNENLEQKLLSKEIKPTTMRLLVLQQLMQRDRWKAIFGENIKSKNEDSQQVEVTIKSEILNNMTKLGMPLWNRVYFLK